MSDDSVVRRAATRAAAFEERRVEPAAMLVGPFEIDVSRPLQVRTVFQSEGVGRSRVEPDVENVGDHLPRLAGAVAKETLACAFSEPCVCTFCLKGFENAGVDGLVLQHFAISVSEDANRHAPGALARQNPVRT